MWKEALVVVLMYLIVLAGHALHSRHQAAIKRRAQAEEDANSLNPISPLFQEGGKLGLHHHIAAGTVAAICHPVSLETIKGYAIHFIVYSGHILPGGH